MAFKEKSITIRVTEDEFIQLEVLAKAHGMSLQDFVSSMSKLLTDDKALLDKISDTDVKNNLEEELTTIAESLEQKKHYLELLLRSIYSTQLRLEGQFKKYRKDASKELEKDFSRISLMIGSMPSKKQQTD